MRRLMMAIIVVATMLLLLTVISPAMAQDGEEEAGPPLLMLTDYPSQVIDVDETAEMELTVRTGTEPQVVRLSVEDAPEGWTATFRGGQQIVRSVFVTPEDEAHVRLQVEPPEDVEPGEITFTVLAESDQHEATLPVELIVQEQAPASLALEAELPTLRGRPDSAFRYNATLRNEGGEELTVELGADLPPGFVATFQSGGQEVTALPLGPNETERINVNVEPINEVPVDVYPITVFARGGDAEASVQLTAEVVGQSSISLTTPSGRLSGEAEAGQETTYTLLLQNTGSAPAHNVQMSSSPPSGWEVTFEPEEVAELAPGTQQEVTARVQPPENTIAGDYVVTFRARPEDVSAESLEYRVTVRTSTLWGAAGVALIAVAVLVVGLAVARFGRR